jgi:DNA-binding NtrC family response regulator
MKVLISWEAFNNDYDEKGNPIINGPNGSFHTHFLESHQFDKHILLTARKTILPVERLVGLINSIHESHQIEIEQVDLLDIIDVNEIKGVISSLLERLKEHQLYFFVSPGTPAMQVAWYLVHLEKADWNTQLVQTRRPSDAKSKQPELSFIEVEKTDLPTSLIKREKTREESFEGVEDEVLISESLKTIYSDAIRVAQAEKINVLIQGPTGSGKEHLAKYIHKQSPRRSKPFVTINCSAFTDELLLSELFGHVKGAFTGAIGDKEGVFESSNGGTIFLDEIGDISPFTQQSLLRVIQSGEIRRVGDSKVSSVNVRILSASHKDIRLLCSKEEFRWDLYYRLSTATLELPSLDDRGRTEKEKYLEFISKQVQSELGKKSEITFGKKVKKHLLDYSYPGNLREMHNIVSTLYVFYDKEVDDLTRLPSIDVKDHAINSLNYEEVEAPFMRAHIEKVLTTTGGNISKAAREIGWAPNTLRDKAEHFGIQIDDYRI